MLAELLHGVSVDHFLDEVWLQKALFLSGPLERLDGFGKITLSAMLDAYRSSPGARGTASAHADQHYIHAWFPGDTDRGWHTGREDAGCVVDAEAAAVLYHQKGANLAFHQPAKLLPELAAWCFQLGMELGDSPGVMYCTVYASPPGSGIQMHFDMEDTLAVQLRGRKVWRYAANESVVNPTDRYMVSDPPQVMPVLQRQLKGKTLPSEMPEGAERIEMTPGSVVYMPRGWWHTTATEDEGSLSISFQGRCPTVAEVLVRQLQRKLSEEERWRRPAGHLFSQDAARRARALEALEADVRAGLGDDPVAKLLDVVRSGNLA